MRFITLNARSRGQKKWYRRFNGNHKQWRKMRMHLNDLILRQRIHLSKKWTRELQQYAEELIYMAKKNDPHNNGIVESILTNPAAREILYEKLVPRYRDRPFYFTRCVNKWQLRIRDNAKMGFIEFVDRPGEYEPAPPVGESRARMVREIMENGSRRERRRHVGEAVSMGILPSMEGIKEDQEPLKYSSRSRRTLFQIREQAEKAVDALAPGTGVKLVGIKPSSIVNDLGEEDAKYMERRSSFMKFLRLKRPATFEEIRERAKAARAMKKRVSEEREKSVKCSFIGALESEAKNESQFLDFARAG